MRNKATLREEYLSKLEDVVEEYQLKTGGQVSVNPIFAKKLVMFIVVFLCYVAWSVKLHKRQDGATLKAEQ